MEKAYDKFNLNLQSVQVILATKGKCIDGIRGTSFNILSTLSDHLRITTIFNFLKTG